ncbi:MAG: hypothetical protein JST84_10865 [Acidobacteria bacterium]|nr:hypothetical protein [Acidobacteriota bacterium]
MPWEKKNETLATVQQALDTRTVDELKKLVTLLPTKETAARKGELIALLERALIGDGLQILWGKLNDLQQKAVSEAVWDEEGRYQADRFKAKYNALPVFAQKSEDRWRAYYGNPTALCLFIYSTARYNNPWQGWQMPRDLQQRLRAFVPQPAAIQLKTTAELPEFIQQEEKEWELADDDEGIRIINRQGIHVMPRKPPKITTTVKQVPLTERRTERAAAQELNAILRLIEKGKLAASEKTNQASGATMEEVAKVLRDGDFYEVNAKPKKGDTEIGAIKAFAWPLLAQAGKLAELNGKKLALTKAGRAALSTAPAESLRLLWQRWLKTKLLDEFNRIDEVKGQYSKGAQMTATEGRRSVIVKALEQCPVGSWVAVDDFFRFMKAAAYDFLVTRNAWELYIEDKEHGSLGYEGHNEFEIIQGRYILCLLFEYAATLGMVDVAYIDPKRARKDYRNLWGADDLDFFSRYDGLLYFRLNTLGAYCLGLTNEYTPQEIEERATLTVLLSLRIQVSGSGLSLDEALLLEAWAEKESDEVWKLSQEKSIAAIENGSQIAELREFLQKRDEQELPDTVLHFITKTERNARALKHKGNAILIECRDAETAEAIATHERLKKLCQRAGEKYLVVLADEENAFRKLLHVVGYGMPRV